MKKLLFILGALACLAWSDNYGDLGTYGSTAYGSTAYGCSSGYTCSTEKKESTTASPSSTVPSESSSSIVSAASNTASSSSSSEPPKPYKYKLAVEQGASFYDADLDLSLGYGGTYQFFMRSGAGRFFVEYGLGLGMVIFQLSPYDDPDRWWTLLAIDGLFQMGIELGRSNILLGTYLGSLVDIDNVDIREISRDYDHGPLLKNKIHYGITLGWVYRFTDLFELGVVYKNDFSTINPEVGNMSLGKRGFSSFAVTGGLVF